MDNPRQSGTEIGKETGESHSADLQALDNATYEPNVYIEQTGDFQQAEAIQTALTALVKPAVSAQDVGATPLPIPRPEDGSIIGDQPKVRGDLEQATIGSEKSEATPINLPGPQPASTASEPAGGEADSLPVPIPSPGEEVSATPITLPGKAGTSVDGSKVPSGEEVSATPITLPGKAGTSVDGSKVPSGEEVSATPITLPGKAGTSVDSSKVPSGEEVSATPITLPGKPGAGKAVLEEGPGRSGVAQDDWESPNAVRMQKGSAAVGEADDLPVPIPSPGVKGTKAEPSLIPENNMAPDADSSGEADSLPLPIPSPKGTDRPAESGRPPGMDPDPVDSTKVPTGEQVSATPITLPGKPGAGKAARGEADSLPIPIPSPKEASSGPAIDPSMDEQLKQRKEQAANDDESAEV